MHQLNKLLTVSITCFASISCSEVREDSTTVDDSESLVELQHYHDLFYGILSYDYVDKLWDKEKDTKTRVYNARNKDQLELLYEYDHIIETPKDLKNEPMKIGDFNSICLTLFSVNIYKGIVHYEDIYVTDLFYGNSLLEFSNISTYKEVDYESIKTSLDLCIGQISFDDFSLDVYSKGDLIYQNGEKAYRSQNKLNIYDFILYCLSHKAEIISIQPSLCFGLSDVLLTKNNKTTYVKANDLIDLIDSMNIPYDYSNDMRNDVTFGTRVFNETFKKGESIIAQQVSITEDGLIKASYGSRINYFDAEGYLYTYYRNFNFGDSSNGYFFARFDTPVVEKTPFRFDIEKINSLFL